MHGGGEEEALVQAKMDPCFYKMALHYVASVCKFGADLTCFSVPIRSLAGWVLVAMRCCGCKPVAPPCFSFRCRSPGAHIACYFFTIHSYLLLSRSGRGSWLDALAARLKGQPPGHGLPPGGGAQGAAPPGRRESLRGGAPLEIRPEGELN